MCYENEISKEAQETRGEKGLDGVVKCAEKSLRLENEEEVTFAY